MKYNYSQRNIGGIYQIKNLINNKIYVGSTINFYNRFLEHRAELRNGYHDNPHLQNAFKKYKEKSFCFNILEICDVSDRNFMYDLEQWYIDVLKPEYNISVEVVNQPMKTLDTRLKQSITRKRLFQENKLKTTCKKVFLYYKDGSFVGEFASMTKAAEFIPTTIDKISGVLHGKFNQIKGYKVFSEKQNNVEPFEKRHYQKGYTLKYYELIDENGNVVFYGDKYQLMKFTGINITSLYGYLNKKCKVRGKYILKSKRAAS